MIENVVRSLKFRREKGAGDGEEHMIRKVRACSGGGVCAGVRAVVGWGPGGRGEVRRRCEGRGGRQVDRERDNSRMSTRFKGRR